MNHFLSLFVALIVSGATLGQSFQWSYPFQRDDETGADVRHLKVQDVYRLKSKYDMDIFNYRISADRFDAKTLEKLDGIDLGLVGPQRRTADKTHLAHYQKEGLDFVFFSSEMNIKTKETQLFWQDVNIKTGEKSDFHLLASVPGKGLVNVGNFRTAQSPNGKFYAVMIEPAFYKKTPETVELEIYDEDFKLVAHIEHEFDWQATRGPEHVLRVGDEGDVYFLKKVELPKMKPYMLVYFWNRGDNTLVEYSLKQDDDYQVGQIHTYFDGPDFYIAALLTDKGSTTFGMKIDMTGRHSGTAGSALFAVKFSGGNPSHQVRNDFDNIISNLSIKTILPHEDKHFVIMEQAYTKEDRSTVVHGATQEVTINYTYLNNGFVISLVEAETGKMAWIHRIATNEPDTRNDDGAFLSVLPFVRNGNLVLIYNESRDLRSAIIHHPMIRRFPVIEIISPNGQTVDRQTLVAAGVGMEEEELFDLDTRVILPVSENKYLIRARSRAEFKYGYMEF